MDYQTRVAEAMKKVLLGHLVSEMGLYQLPIPFDNEPVRYILDAGKGIKGLQNLYVKQPQCGNIFRENFNDRKNVLYAEILGSIYGLDENSLEDILEAIKRHTNDTND